ncbi:MAG: RsmD family RNA methyltransferase [Pirellulaceae bacterium]|nr:RsmD family RNA methyltransferase [Pirellulaceae bacterium]
MRARQPAHPDSAVSGTLRIIGGSLRGRPIAYTGDPRTRPMKQRVREAVFNLVGHRVVGTHALDLFAGTGALAWEALSRGAVRATLIERHFPTVRLIRQNAAALGLADRVSVVAGDAFVWAPQLPATPPLCEAALPWLLFCAPPYSLYVGEAPALMALLSALASRAPNQSVFVVEADERFDPALLPASCQWDIRGYPPAVIAVGDVRNPLPAGVPAAAPQSGQPPA